LMGFFVNMLPLRMRVSGEASMTEWLRSVHDMVVESFSFPDVPFDHLVRELNVPRDASRPPIHQVSFSYQDVRERSAKWGNVDHQRMPTPMLGAAQDLSLWCVETRNHIEFVFTFNADVLDTASVALFAQRLESVLRQIVLNPNQPLSKYDILPPAEQTKLQEWNATAAGFDREATVHALVAAQVQRTPDAIALEQPRESALSYAELSARVNRLAHRLRGFGIQCGDLVGLCVERSVDMVVAQLAVLESGAAYVPLDPAYPAERLAFMAQDSQLALLITHSELVHALDWPRERSLLLDVDAASIATQPGHSLPRDAGLDARPDDPAYVIYTSGSTGKPKGVIVPHGAVVNFLLSMQREPGLVASDRLLAVTTLSFDIAVLELLLPLTVGATVILAGREQAIDGHDLRALIETSGATVMQATPTTWRMLLDAGWQGPASFKALIGGEALPPDLAQEMAGRAGELWNMYGPTETTVWSTCWKVERPEQGISIGRPICNTQVHVLDERNQPCPIGVPGEICIGGDGVTMGYLHRPELTSERFIDDPFSTVPNARLYRTGDRGRWRHDGLLEHMGRLDFQVKVRGHRIELGEIESALTRHAQVARSVVVVRELQPGDSRLVAYVVPKAGMPEVAELREHLRSGLPEYMLPQHYVRLEAIPLLPNGKIDRQALPAPEVATALHEYSIVAPSTPAEIVVAEIWQRLLGVDQIGVTDNFFDLGGHSLLAMRAVTEIEKRVGIRVHVRRMIFENLAQIASTPSPELAEAGTASKEGSGWLNRMMGKLRS
jgi:amino acid adenylation domain-containing protein